MIVFIVYCGIGNIRRKHPGDFFSPYLTLADEPTGNLDAQNSSEVITLLKNASKRYAQTIIMITQNAFLTCTIGKVGK